MTQQPINPLDPQLRKEKKEWREIEISPVPGAQDVFYKIFHAPKSTRVVVNKWRQLGYHIMQWDELWRIAEESDQRFLIVAGNYEQFRSWCDAHHISHKHPCVRFVSDPHTLYGYHKATNVHLIKYGTWEFRSDIDHLRDAIRIFEQFNPPSSDV